MEQVQFSDGAKILAQTIDSAELTYTVDPSQRLVLEPLSGQHGFLSNPDYDILGRDGQVVLSNSGEFIAMGLSGEIKVTNMPTGETRIFSVPSAIPYGNFAPVAVSDSGEDVFFVTWNGLNPTSQGYGGVYKFHIDFDGSGEPSSLTRVDTNSSGSTFTYQGWSIDSSAVDISADGRFVAFAARDLITPNVWDSGQKTNIYVKDTLTNSLTHVDLGNNNKSSSNPKISDDGRYVLFES
jgi:hypothetical protein